MSPTHPRPLSPHLSIWKWGPGMLVSILHRVTGGALTTAGLAFLTWWLMALSGDASAYERFESCLHYELFGVVPLMMIVLFGLVLAFWQHLFSGLRHLVLDTGAGYDLRVNKFWAVMTMPLALFASFLTLWFLMGVGR